VLEKNPEKVKFVFKNFPIRSHKFATKGAIGAMAAHEQGKFWEFHDLLFKNHSKLDDKMIEGFATQLGLDKEAYDNKIKDPAVLGQVRNDYNDGIQAGVRGTPALYVNGRKIKNRSLQGFQELIDRELAQMAKN
jgi:protein-disulfide isomerase